MKSSLDKYQLKEFLEEKYKQYAVPSFVNDDPSQFPHRFSKKEDIEIAGILAATISWGNRKMIVGNMDRLMQKMGDSPYEFVVNYSKRNDHLLDKFVHRTFNGVDCIHYIKSLKHIYTLKGGLQKVFSDGYQSEQNIKGAIKEFRKQFVDCETPAHTLVHVANVEKGSACKRINMFLRWMVRPSSEGIDLGIWNNIPASALMMPLDVHSGRVSRALGLLNRKQSDWKAVEELTSFLRELDPNDPVKFDYALFGLGVYEKFGQ
ncbi:MAG: TIGR02757 family protein [Bacteroidales bacterium]|nr:TIGR02757 family protein [Bacteroidales bacterium]